MKYWSAVLRRFAFSTVPSLAGAMGRGFQIHCSVFLKHSLSSVLFRETIGCKAPLFFLSTTNFSSSPSKPSSDVHLLTISDEENKCGEHDQVKRGMNANGLMRKYHLENTGLVAVKEYENNTIVGDEEGGDNARLCQYGIPVAVNAKKQVGNSLEFCGTAYKDDLASDESSFRKNKKSDKKFLSYEGAGFREEEDVEYHRKLKQVGWQGERFHLFKSRGQHLLTNPRVLDSIIRRAKVLPTDTVLEIGPGTGNLTVRLLKCARKVIAVEIDERMVDAIRNRVSKLGLEDKLVIITGNALKMELPHFDICVSNIPYGISSPLIAKIFLRSYKPCFRSATLLLQKEFARRLLAKPGESDFNRLAVNVRLVASVDFLMNVSKKDFVPCPKVDSSLVQIQPKLNIPDINLDEWLAFTRTCFSKRNKTLCAIFKQKKKIINLYEKSQSNSVNCKTLEFEDQVSDYDVDGDNESDDGDIGTCSLDLGEQNSTEVLRFKEKIVRILKDGGFGEKRPSKLSNEELLYLLQIFNKESVFFR